MSKHDPPLSAELHDLLEDVRQQEPVGPQAQQAGRLEQRLAVSAGPAGLVAGPESIPVEFGSPDALTAAAEAASGGSTSAVAGGATSTSALLGGTLSKGVGAALVLGLGTWGVVTLSSKESMRSATRDVSVSPQRQQTAASKEQGNAPPAPVSHPAVTTAEGPMPPPTRRSKRRLRGRRLHSRRAGSKARAKKPTAVGQPSASPIGRTAGPGGGPRLAPSTALKKSPLHSEQRLLAAARRHLRRGQSEAVLKLVRQHRALHPAGKLDQERDLLEVRALHMAGRRRAARRAAKAFRARYPGSLGNLQLRAILGD